MIDLHCHILPGLDDGAKDWNEALGMCRIAVKEGIEKIVATPHSGDGVYQNFAPLILERVAELNYRIQLENIPLEIIPGADVHIQFDLLAQIRKNQVLTIANQKKYILMELPQQIVPKEIKKIVFDLQIEGITPVISHPERNWEIQSQPERAAELVELGALLQLTAGSLNGDFGGETKKCAQKLLKKGLIKILASDAHSPTWRPPQILPALLAARKLIGNKAEDLVTTFPRAIIEGQLVE